MTDTALHDSAPATATPAPPHIYAATRAIMAKVAGVPKAGEFKFSSRDVDVAYKFQKYDDMAAALGSAFREQGVMIQASIIELTVTEWDKSKNNATQRNARVVIRKLFRFTSLVDGSTLEIEAAGEGADNSDKAVNKAETGALKNALKQAFLLSTGEDDPDSTRPDDTGQPVVVNDPSQKLEQARQAVAFLDRCNTTGDVDLVYEWAGRQDLLNVPVDGLPLGARLQAAKGTLPGGPARGQQGATEDGH